MLRRALPLSLVCLFALPAAAADLRFNTTAAGNVVATGNTLGLAKQLSANGPGTEDSIGTFITLDANSVDNHPVNLANPWPGGTTDDWTENGSAADLVLPKDTEVLYAELVWGGSTYYGVEDVRPNLDDAITITFGGDTLSVEPDAATPLDIDTQSMTVPPFFVRYYMRTADVTAFVAEHGPGTYAVNGVPATQDDSINSLNAAGWTLVVAYRDSVQPIRNLTVFVGGSFVDEESTVDYSFEGFCTPPMGPFDGSVVVSAIEGDADIVGDGLAIAETDVDPFIDLGGPNNPQNNFFASQLNDASGNLDTSGTFGTVNHNAVLGTNTSGGRQGWDITQLPLSSAGGTLDNGQTAAVLRTQTTGDSFVPTTVAFAIGVNAPDFSGRNTLVGVDPGSLAIDETADITISMTNSGLVNADGVTLTAPLPAGLELDGFTIDGVDGDADGNAVATGDLETGVDIGTVGPDVTLEVVMTVRAAEAPVDDAGWDIAPQWNYSYVSCVGQDPLEEPYVAVPVHIDYEEGAADTSGGGSEESTGPAADTSDGDSDSNSMSNSDGDATASDSETDTNADTSSASDSISGGASEDSDDGCGCTEGDKGGARGWLALGLLAFVGRRRRR
jgi:uncharacterized repeat protein (TIGR01451 family)/MYXO-CTERM domain-containing protein